MRMQRGNQLYVALGAVLLISLLVGAVLWYVERERDEAFAAGEVKERGRWEARESQELRAVNAQLIAAQARADELERQAAEDLAALDIEHDKEFARVQADRDRFLDDLRAGRVRFGAAAAGACPGGDTAGEAAAAAGGRDAQARSEFPDALSRAVAGGARLAAEADEVVLQLGKAQGVIETYLKTCNARPPPS